MAQSDIGLRELKQNASEVVSRAEAGARFRVVRNGKPTNVVIELDPAPKRRWVSRSDITELFAAIEPDTTGWSADNDRHRDNDPITDPWQAA